MRFLTLSESKHYPQTNIFKASSVKAFIVFIMCVLLIGGIPTMLFIQKEMPIAAFVIIELFGLIFYSITLNIFLKTLKPSNWLINIQPSELLVKFRSFQNCKLPETDKQIASIGLSEIQSANKTTVHLITQDKSQKGGSKTKSQIIPSIDLHLKQESSEFAAILKEERSKKIQTKNGSSISQHYPVILINNNIVRINFQGVTPGLDKALKILKDANIEITEPQKVREDFTKSIKSDEDLEKAVLALMVHGEKMSAQSLVRTKKRLGLSESKEYVAKIMEKAERGEVNGSEDEFASGIVLIETDKHADEDFQKIVATMAERGETLAAIQLVRKQLGLGLKEAKDYVNKL